MKKFNPLDPHQILNYIQQLENHVAQPAFDLNARQDVPVPFRVDEKVGPGKFKSDPLVPGGYVANSLTLKAMRKDIFVLGDSLDDLQVPITCACGEELDLQFWRLCPHCGKELKP